jgi:two-component system, chemotaxis family, protein-glutamate methylesterase/glutaminase
MTQPIRILIVDDSAFARKVVREILTPSPSIDLVGAARDGAEALELTATLHPDLVICDLQMPRLDGVEFVRRQMRVRPIPILILTAASEDAAELLEALSAGAVDFVQKPSALASDDLRTIRAALIEKIEATVKVTLRHLTPAAVAGPLAPIARRSTKLDAIVLGISTGGPQALRRIMPLFPSDFPVPIAIVLHMPIGYTAMFAEKLNELCALEVKEAADGDLFRSGRVLLAPAGRHLGFRRITSGEIVAQLSLQPLDKLHRPSADVLFTSAAELFRERLLAVVMTGMGDDGKEGAAWVKAQGGSVITESENSCVIYGMPRSVVEAGLSDAAVSLEDMVPAIISRL